MRTPLDVVLSDSGGSAPDSHIGLVCGDLQIGAQSPGGYTGGSLTLDEPILSDFLLQYDTVSVYDTRSAAQVNGGRLVEPAKSVSDRGEVWQVEFIGEGPAHMQDVTVPRVYIESQLDGFYPKVRFVSAATSQVGATPDGLGSPPSSTSDSAVVIAAPGGTVLGNGVVGAMLYDRLVQTGQVLGGVGYTRLAGKAAVGGDYQNEFAVHADDGAPAGVTTVASNNFSTSSVAMGPFVVGTDWTAGMDTVRFNVRKSAGGAITVVDDTTWGAFFNVYVAARRKSADGTDAANASHANAYVLASDVVKDLLGRDLPRFDGANSTVTATTHHIDQLAYIDGATPYQIVQDLLALESAFTWHVWGANSAGLYQFEWVAWPTTVRYEASVIDGFSSPAPADDLFNQVNVRYKDAKGRIRWTTRTQTVAALGSLTRTAMLDLSDEVGSLANANRAGDRFLADHAAPPNAGTLTIARPITDATLGRLVQPWEIRPGNLIRVRGVRPYLDSLNASDRDGVTVFRIVSTEFSDSQGAATLELDAYTPDEARQIARLMTQRRRRR